MQVCGGSGSDDILDIIMRLVDADTCIISTPTFGMCVLHRLYFGDQFAISGTNLLFRELIFYFENQFAWTGLFFAPQLTFLTIQQLNLRVVLSRECRVWNSQVSRTCSIDRSGSPEHNTRNPEPDFRNPEPERNHAPATRILEPETRNPNPGLETRNSKPETLNLKPGARDPKPGAQDTKP